MENITFYSLLPFLFILPFLGIFLIQSNSPIKALIYRSFLGSIAALIYSLIGAPDVALTEVLVGTLLSTLIYIISIRGCYSLILLIKEDELVDNTIYEDFKKAISELHFHLVVKTVKELNFDENDNINWDETSILNGSPHAAIKENKIYVESKVLSDELLKTKSLKEKNLIIK